MNLSQAGKKIAEYPILFVCGLLTPLIVVLLVMRGPKVTYYEQELSSLEREWHNIQTNVERAAGMETDIERLEQGLEVVRQRLMQVENVAVNYEFFYDLERESGIVLSRFSRPGWRNSLSSSMTPASRPRPAGPRFWKNSDRWKSQASARQPSCRTSSRSA